MKKNKKGFTLAEVLITMTIIGVVAAISMPLLTAAHKPIEYAAKVKKAYNAVDNAIEISKAEYNLSRQQIFSSNNGLGRLNSSSINDFYNNFIANNIKVSKKVSVNNDNSQGQGQTNNSGSGAGAGNQVANNALKLYLEDGTTLTLTKNNNMFSIMFVDINGDKVPNLIGKDVYAFSFNTNNNDPQLTKYTFGRYCSETYGDNRDNFVNNCKNQGNEPVYTNLGEQASCTCLLMTDGWKYADDYPVKI